MISLFKKGPPKTITLRHYIIYFKTVDGELHTFTKLAYCDESSINCSALEMYLIGKERLEDDTGAYYPMSNVVKVYAELDDVIENVIAIEKSDCFYWPETWYKRKDIEVYNSE